MTRVEKIEKDSQSLTPAEFSQLREWLLEQDWTAWDQQIERDAASGKLDDLIRRAVEDHSSGKSRPL